jgi:hypothetical protein
MADPLSSECGPVRNPLQSKGDQPQPHTSKRQSYRSILDSNGLDAFLTLEKKLPRSIEKLKNRNEKVIDFDLAILRPTDLLQLLGITTIDTVPIQPGRFYTYMEIFQINDKMING